MNQLAPCHPTSGLRLHFLFYSFNPFTFCFIKIKPKVLISYDNALPVTARLIYIRALFFNEGIKTFPPRFHWIPYDVCGRIIAHLRNNRTLPISGIASKNRSAWIEINDQLKSKWHLPGSHIQEKYHAHALNGPEEMSQTHALFPFSRNKFFLQAENTLRGNWTEMSLGAFLI